MRNLVKSREVVHLWAHQSQDHARTPGAMRFDGPDFYSYGAVIGSVITGKDGQRGYLVSTRRWSVTTSAHQGHMRSAIPFDAPVFHVPQISANPERVLEGWASEIGDLLRTAARSRKPKNTRLLAEAAALVESMRKFAAFMGIKKPNLPKLPGTVEEITAAIAAEDYRKVRRQRAAAKRIATVRQKHLVKQRLVLEEWETGASVYPDAHELPTSLRVVGGTVETSRGASFPVAHALRGLALVDSVRARGEEWRTNGHTCHLGHYRIDRITPDGTVYAGCHVVPFAAIERIRPALQAAQ